MKIENLNPEKPRFAMAMYRPRPGQEEKLRQLIAEHVPTLRKLELITDREAYCLRAADGTFIEIFEWASEAAVGIAHTHPEVARVWEGMGQIADFPGLGDLPEANARFPNFEPVTLS